MITRSIPATGLITILLLATGGTALTQTNTVPGTRAGRSSTPINANTLKPSSCSSLTLANTVQGVTGGSANELVLATALADTISAGGGNDCILAGGGNDNINCGTGTDIAIGGPGADTFNSNCETQIP